MYTYVRTFLIRMRALVICDRNSIATKREEFPARVVEVASSRLHFASLAHLLQLFQQTYPQYWFIINSLTTKVGQIDPKTNCFFLLILINGS